MFAAVTDPVGEELIAGFGEPPLKNFSGVSYPLPVKERFAFIQRVMPDANHIGLIYADMPQSHSYKQWIEALLKQPEFETLNVYFREVDFVKSDGGHIRMARLARKFVEELNPHVDVFLSANDQMGAQQPFAEIVYDTATKPLIGLGKKDVMDNWGATMSIFASQEEAGRQAAEMITKLFEGIPLKEIFPEEPRAYGVAFDMNKAAQFGIAIPADLLEMAGENVVK